jgi:hypothetical protein
MFKKQVGTFFGKGRGASEERGHKLQEMWKPHNMHKNTRRIFEMYSSCLYEYFECRTTMGKDGDCEVYNMMLVNNMNPFHHRVK